MSDNVMKREYRQNQMALKARIKHRTQSLQSYKQHLKNGTFPKRMKSLKPYPKMDTPQAQAKVNEACQLVDKVILDQMIYEQALKLKQDQESYDDLRQQQQEARQQRMAPLKKHHPKTSFLAELQRDLKDLQTKYTELCQKLTPVKQESSPTL